MTTWGFGCTCELCDAEKMDNPEIREKRQKLVEEANAFVSREGWANAKRITVAKAQRLSRAIDDTYDSQRYAGMPRFATETIGEWLTKATLPR